VCGIAGVYFRDGRPVDRDLVRRMGDSIAHRGPDGEGLYIDQNERAIGLVSRRLAVIDLEGGHQPMTIAGGAYTIVYNGELFNSPEVRRELERAGHRFETNCDTEIVVRGYAEWGPDVLQRLNGMWAFAVWDRTRRRLFLARDRLGVKPLVYADTPDGLVFGSEIKALVASRLVERDLDPGALPHYLSAFAVPEPYTLVRKVRRLRSGHALIVEPDGLREFEYWDCAVEEDPDAGRQIYRDEIASLLEDSVRRRLVSDVPLGVLLSGGIDSRLMATFAARGSDAPVRTFTLGFDGGGTDERYTARAVARELGADHHEDVIGAQEAAASLPELLAAYDEPGESLIQNHMLSRFARRYVTVALSGIGGDELFSSYPTHVIVSALRRFDRIPSALRAPLRSVAQVLPVRRLRNAAALAAMDPAARVTRRLIHQTDAAQRADLLAPAVRAELDLDAPARHIQAHYDRARSHHPLNRLLYVYIKTYLPDELLRATDAMSMLHSLEVRTPFLDYRLVERAMSVPAHHKMRLTKGKVILREIAKQRLPLDVGGPKRGFSPPIDTWLRTTLGEQVRDVLAEPAIARRGIFDPVAVHRTLTAFRNGDTRCVAPVMMLYAFETWARHWLDAQPAVPAPAPIPVRTPEPALSIIVVNWNTQEMLHDCLASIAKYLDAVEYEVIVVDNASGDGSADMVASEFPEVRLVCNSQNLGFAVANNQAMRMARSRWLLLLNSDSALRDGSVATLFQHVRDEADVGVAQCRLEFPDGRLQHTAYRFTRLHLAVVEQLGLYKLLPSRWSGALLLSGYWDYAEERDVDWVSGAFMLVRREVFEQTGGFDEQLFMYGEDMEWCERIRDLGWRVRYYPQASIVHRNHASSEIRWGDDRIALCLRRQRDIYVARHGRLQGALLVALQATGAALRTAYYSLRVALGGRRASAYRDMRRSTLLALRACISLSVGRR
jgi:asparagine synthase (glutamine-hydrolysing)